MFSQSTSFILIFILLLSRKPAKTSALTLTCGKPKFSKLDPFDLASQFARLSTSTTITPTKTTSPKISSTITSTQSTSSKPPTTTVKTVATTTTTKLPAKSTTKSGSFDFDEKSPENQSTTTQTPSRHCSCDNPIENNQYPLSFAYPAYNNRPEVFRTFIPTEHRGRRLNKPLFSSNNRDLFDKPNYRWKKEISNKIVGGFDVSDATGGKICWQVVIQVDGKFQCAGSIIGVKTILTGAHCVLREGVRIAAERISVLTGVLSRNNRNGTLTQVKNCGGNFTVISAIPRPDYDTELFNNDLAVVILKEEINFNGTCACPICLLNKEPMIGEVCVNSGHGETQDGRAVVPLKWLKLTVLFNNDTNCQLFDGTTPELFICAGDRVNESSCFGDSGGPLVCWDTAQKLYYLAGSVSHGSAPICAVGLGTQYTKIAKYLDWIATNSGG